MNSYSRETLRHGWHKTANGPYGAPRGNAVMKAKRITGESAQARLCRQHTRDLAKEHAWLDSQPGIAPRRAAPWYTTAQEDVLGRGGMFT